MACESKLPYSINIGYTGEIDARHVVLDISDLVEMWPDANPVILYIRHGETDRNPAANVERIGNTLKWTFTEFEASIRGLGKAAVWMYGPNGVLGKSAVMTTVVSDNLPGDFHQMDDPVKVYVESVLRRAEAARAEAVAASEQAVQAQDGAESAATEASGYAGAAIDAANASANSARQAGQAAKAADELVQRIPDFSKAIDDLEKKEGDLADLATKDKSSLVAAINEAAQSGGGSRYDDTELRNEIKGLQDNKADRSEIPAPYNDGPVKASIKSLQDGKADKSEIPAPYNDGPVRADIKELQDNKADKTEIPAPYNDAPVKESIKALQDGKADKSEIPAPYDDTGIQTEIRTLKNNKQDKLVAGEGVVIEADGKTISAAGGGGDIIQDPSDPDGGVVAPGTLADIDQSLTLHGYAADAGVVGERISAMNRDLSLMQTDVGDLKTALIGVDAAADAIMEVVGVE